VWISTILEKPPKCAYQTKTPIRLGVGVIALARRIFSATLQTAIYSTLAVGAPIFMQFLKPQSARLSS